MGDPNFYIKTVNESIIILKKEYLKYCDIFKLFEIESENNSLYKPFLLLNIDDFNLIIIKSLFENKDDKSKILNILMRHNKEEIFKLIDVCNYLICELLLDLIINYLSKLFLANTNENIIKVFNLNYYIKNLNHLEYFHENNNGIIT